jgi:hypothetical protein
LLTALVLVFRQTWTHLCRRGMSCLHRPLRVLHLDIFPLACLVIRGSEREPDSHPGDPLPARSLLRLNRVSRYGWSGPRAQILVFNGGQSRDWRQDFPSLHLLLLSLVFARPTEQHNASELDRCANGYVTCEFALPSFIHSWPEAISLNPLVCMAPI